MNQIIDSANADLFKQAMRRLATTVSIVTSHLGTERRGMVATSVSGFTAEPPAILVGINVRASVHQAIMDSGYFCANLLSSRHEPLVAAFSGGRTGEDRFSIGEWEADRQGCPRLVDAMAAISCAVDGELSYGTHSLFIGRIIDIRLMDGIDPMIWQEGGFYHTCKNR